MMKESNFVENYQQLPTGTLTIPDSLLADETPAGGDELRALVCNAVRRSSVDGGDAGGQGWADGDWSSVRAKLAALRAAAPPGSVWRLALPKNHVVAVRLTADVLRACFAHVGLALNEHLIYYREETYKPGYCEFRVGDYAVRPYDAFALPTSCALTVLCPCAAVRCVAGDQHDSVRPRQHARPRVGVEAAQQGTRPRDARARMGRSADAWALISCLGDAGSDADHAHDGRGHLRCHLRGGAPDRAAGRQRCDAAAGCDAGAVAGAFF